MNVNVAPELVKFVESKVQTGQFLSADDVVNSALESFRENESIQVLSDDELRRQALHGISVMDSGDRSPLDFEELKMKIRNKLATE